MPAKESRVYQVLALAVMAGMALLVLATFRDYGITNDEELQDNYGHMLLAYYASGLTDHTAFGYQDLCLYGGLFDLMAALFERVLPLGTYESRHLLGGLAGLLGLAGAWRLGRHLGGERAGFLAVALTVLTPALYGHNFNNPKDAPFAIAMLWSLYFSVRASEDFPRPRLATVLGLGLAFGAALSVRVGALLVPFYAAFAVAVFLAAGLVRGRDWAAAGRDGLVVISRGLAALPPALLLVALFWPWVVRAPGNLLEAARHFTRMPGAEYDTIMAGMVLTGNTLPRGYLAAYILVTMPELVLAGAGLALLVALRRLPGWLRATPPALLASRLLPVLAVVFPVAYFAIMRPSDLEGLRHFLFVVPPLVVLAALGLEWTWRRTGWAFAALLAVAMATQAGLMVRLHPQEYAYYNQLVGGVRGAELKWEGDYWSNGMGQAARLLAEALRDERPARPYKVGVCANDNNTLSAMYVLPPNFIFIDRWEDADFVIANDDCWRDQPGRMIARFERLGVTYAAAFDRRALPAGN